MLTRENISLEDLLLNRILKSFLRIKRRNFKQNQGYQEIRPDPTSPNSQSHTT